MDTQDTMTKRHAKHNLAKDLNKSTRLNVAFGGFLIIAGILFTAAFTLTVLVPGITEILGNSCRLLLLVMTVGVLDVVAGVLLRRG